MADSVASSAVQVKRQFCRLLPAEVILDACREASHVFRKRVLDTVPKKFEEKWGKGAWEAIESL